MFSIFKNNDFKTTFLYKIVFFFLILCASFIIIFFVYKSSRYNLIVHDDSSLFFRDNFINMYFVNVYKAKYTGNFLTIFFGLDLPARLGIHPVVWIKSGGALIKGFFFFLLSCAYASCLYIKNAKDLFFPFAVVFLFFYIQSMTVTFYMNEMYTSFYCFTFPFIFFFVFWRQYLNHIIWHENKHKSHILLYISAFFLGTSCEITAFSSFLALILILLFNLFFSILSENSLKTSLYSFLSLSTGVIVYTSHPMFRQNLAVKTGSFYDKGITFLSSAIDMWDKYVEGIKLVLPDHFNIYNLILLICFVFLIVLRSKNRRGMLLTLSSIIISCYAFWLSLIFAGKGPSDICFVTHADIIVQMKMMLVSVIIVFLSLIPAKILKYPLFTVLIIFLIFNNFKIYDYTPDFKNLKYPYSHSKEEYTRRYINERIAAFYSYGGFKKLHIMPDFVFDTYFHNLYGNYVSEFDFIENEDDVYLLYLKNGGCEITSEEIEKADFQKLSDKKYVLTCKD